MASRTVVYTVIVCGRDTLREPAFRPPGVDFVCFTDDRSIRSRSWEMRPPVRTYADPALTVRRHKLLPYEVLPDYETHLWLDGSLELTGDAVGLIEAGGELGLFPHRQRRCAYEEAGVVIETRRGVPEEIQAQMHSYREAGFPSGFGLWEAGAIVRRNTPAIRRLCEAWWAEVCRHTTRDQLSFPFALWSLGMTCRSLPGTIADNPWLRLHPHPYLPHPRYFAEVFGPDRRAWPGHARRHPAALEAAGV